MSTLISSTDEMSEGTIDAIVVIGIASLLGGIIVGFLVLNNIIESGVWINHGFLVGALSGLLEITRKKKIRFRSQFLAVYGWLLIAVVCSLVVPLIRSQKIDWVVGTDWRGASLITVAVIAGLLVQLKTFDRVQKLSESWPLIFVFIISNGLFGLLILNGIG